MIGKIVCDLRPSADNRRNSEGAFIKLKDGRIMYAYSRYHAGHHDHDPADIYAIFSSDNGETFGAPELVISAESVGAHNLMSVSLIRLRSGRWLMPASKLTFDASFGTDGSISIFASYDDGFTWRAVSEGNFLPVSLWHEYNSFNRCAMEPGVVELDDGLIWCFIRTRLDRQYEMLSRDGGETWSLPNPSRFTSSNAPLSAKKLSNGKIFVVWNPIQRFTDREYKGEYIKTKWCRTPLAYAVLDNEGGKFLAAGDLEDDRDRGFCYTAIHETDEGDILLGYCAGSVKEDGGWLNRISIRRITKGELDSLINS